MPGLTKYRPALALGVFVGLAACGFSDQTSEVKRSPLILQIGDPEVGRAVILRTGCGSCHEIPGIKGARGRVGPPLEHVASRRYLAGVLRNTPEAMAHWIRFPQAVVPGNAMPNMGLTEEEARNVTAFLYTLK